MASTLLCVTIPRNIRHLQEGRCPTDRVLNGGEFARLNTSGLCIADGKYQSASRRPHMRLHGRIPNEWGPLLRAPARAKPARERPGLTALGVLAARSCPGKEKAGLRRL